MYTNIQTLKDTHNLINSPKTHPNKTINIYTSLINADTTYVRKYIAMQFFENCSKYLFIIMQKKNFF